jgi:drug/metabolite transporter (DMT)-like permease
MLGASVAFAGMAACIKLASLHGVPTAQIMLFRGLVSLALLGLYQHRLRVPFATPHWKAHLQRGVVSFFGMLTYVGGISLLPLATAVTLNYTSPVILALLLHFMAGERSQPHLLASIAGGLVGVVLLLKPSYDHSLLPGALLALASALLAAIAALNIRALGRLDEPPSRTVLYFSLCITVGSLPLFLFGSHPAPLDAIGTLDVIAVGALATLGQFMLTLAYQRGQALLVSLLGYSQVVFTSLIGIVLWDNHPTVSAWLGMALIIVSGAIGPITSLSARQSAPRASP